MVRLAAVVGVAGALALAALYRRRVRASVLAGSADARHLADAALVIVVDVGSSSVRASCFALVDAASGRARAHAQRDGAPVEWVMLRESMQQLPMDGVIDENGEADIRRIEGAVERVVGGVLTFLRAAGLAKRVRAVGFSTFVMNLVGVDAKGEAVTPVYTYAGRRPSAAACARELREKLVAQGSLDEVHDRTGTVIHPAYAPAEFLRLHYEEPTLVARVSKWQTISSYLLTKWTLAGERGSLPVSYTEASWSGLLDFRRCCWYEPLLEMVHMDLSKMPSIQDSAVPISGLRECYANKWPELANTPFFLGIGDGAAANVGSKCIDSKRVAITIGTSAAVRVVVHADSLRSRKVPKGLWCYRIGSEHVMLGGALNDGGSVYQFLRKTLNVTADDIDARLAKFKPAQHGLTVLPFFSGERAPGWRDEASCTITGMTKWTQPVDVLHAGMEGVALRIATVFSLLASYAESDAALVASGTALTSSRAWRQILADAIGRELVVETSANEATSRGIAVFIGTYLGLHSLVDSQHLDSSSLVKSLPTVEAHAIYLNARQNQESLYNHLYN